MSKTASLLTLDGVHVAIGSVYFTDPSASILAGGLDFVWEQCVEKAPERIKRMWSGPPVFMLKPPRHDPKKDHPPRWRVAVRLENWSPIKAYDPKKGEMEGSHLTLIFFRQTLFDQPIDDIIALAVAQIEWNKHADDWSF